MAADRGAIMKEVAEICWYMRGGVTWDQAWQLTQPEKIQIFKTIKENVERMQKTGTPI